MRDAEVVASVVAGDPAGLAEAYDRYAGPLYAYCWFMLDDPAEAAEAVRDTFLIAASRLGRLRDPERLRPWLHAAARNECLRRLGTRQAAPAPDAAADTASGGLDITADPERIGLRALVRSAVGGLNPGDREVIVLRLGLGMQAAEVAMVLGVSRNRERSLLSRARGRLRGCLGMLLVGLAGRDDCHELYAMLAGWDGRLTAGVRKRLQRHIERCATCADRGGAELRRATLPGMPPAESLAIMTAENTWLAASAPAGLRDHVLWMATTEDDDALTFDADLRSRAGAFGRGGFPKPLPVPKSGWYWSPQGKVAVLGGVAMVIAAFVVTLALTGNWLPGASAGSNQAGNAATQPAPPAPAATGAAAAPAAPVAQQTPTPHPSPSATASNAPQPAANRPSAHPTAKHTATASQPAGLPTTPAPTASTGTPVAPPPPTATQTPTRTPTTAPGTLVVSTGTLDLNRSDPSGAIMLTAENGPVTWSISQTGGAEGLVISPAEGALAEGQSVQVTVTATGVTRRFTAELTVSPGGQTVTVVYNARSF